MMLDNTSVRLGPDPTLGGLPGVFMPLLEWQMKRHHPRDFGFVATADQPGGFAVPQTRGIGLDVGAGNDVRLIRQDSDVWRPAIEIPTSDLIAEVAFSDRHPQQWLDQLAQSQYGLVAVGPTGPASSATIGEWVATLHVAAVPVFSYLSSDGVGITTESPPAEDRPVKVSPKKRHIRTYHEWLTNFMVSPTANDDLYDKILSSSDDDRGMILLIAGQFWHVACSDAATQGAFTDDEDARAQSIAAAIHACKESGLSPETLGQAGDLAAALLHNDGRTAFHVIATALEHGALYLAILGYFTRAHAALLHANAAHQNRSVEDLLRQVRDQLG